MICFNYHSFVTSTQPHATKAAAILIAFGAETATILTAPAAEAATSIPAFAAITFFFTAILFLSP